MPYIGSPWPQRPIHIKPRTFCCCIPVDAGTILLAFLTAIGSASLAITAVSQLFTGASSWWEVWAILAAGQSRLIQLRLSSHRSRH